MPNEDEPLDRIISRLFREGQRPKEKTTMQHPQAEQPPKSEGYLRGFQYGERMFQERPDRADWANPFAEGTDEGRGFEDAVEIFTQK